MKTELAYTLKRSPENFQHDFIVISSVSGREWESSYPDAVRDNNY